MAEIEQASLRSEQLSDKSSSPALPDDLSLDEHTAFPLLTREGTVSDSVIRRGMGSFVSWELQWMFDLGSKSFLFCVSLRDICEDSTLVLSKWLVCPPSSVSILL